MTFRYAAIAIAALVLVACVSTTIRDAWVDPAYRGGPLRKILVLGVSPNLSERRIFEDIMSARLSTVGVDAVPAYRFLPEAGRAEEAALDTAVRASGADGLLMSRVLHIDRRTNVFTSMRSGPPFGPGFGWYGLYTSWYPVTEVWQYDIATVETTLFAADGKRVLWSGMTETYEPTSVARDAPGFAGIIVKALQERGLVPAGK